jgi:serine protease Do
VQITPGTRCFKCGHRTPENAAECPGCGTSLRTDVVVEAEVGDSRAVYLAAREIDELGGEAPVFAEIKTRLLAAPGAVARGCPQPLARGMIRVLRKHGIVARLVPARRPGRHGAASRGVIGVDLVVARLRRAWRTMPIAVKLATAGLGGVIVLFLAGQWDGGGQHVQRDAGARLSPSGNSVSSREIAFAAVAATAHVSCPGSTGIGFYVDGDRLVTTLRLPSGGRSDVEVELPGRGTIHGSVERADAWLGLAVIRVPGAHAAPLPLGDATTLALGDPVITCGAPRGHELTVTQGIVSQPSRELMGTSFLQIDGGIRPGESGGPVLDRSGRVVGISAEGVAAGPGSSLAIPVNYLYSGDEPLVARSRNSLERTRWSDRMARTAAAEQEELQAFQASMESPLLTAARLSPRGSVEVEVVRHGRSPRAGDRLTFRLLADGVLLCEPRATIARWQPVSSTTPEIGGSRFLMWLGRHRLSAGWYAGMSLLDLHGCPGPAGIAGSQLVLEDGEPRADRVRIAAPPPSDGRPG